MVRNIIGIVLIIGLTATMCLAAETVYYVGPTGLTLTTKEYYDNAGTLTLREAVVMTEEPVASGLYKVSLASPAEGDILMVFSGTLMMGAEEYTMGAQDILQERIEAGPAETLDTVQAGAVQ